MNEQPRHSKVIRDKGVTIETYLHGAGPAFVILPSYGRDGGDDYDDITSLVIEQRMCIRAFSKKPVVLLGHAFGNVLARVVTTDHPDLVKAVILAAAEASKVPEDVGKTPFIVGDPETPEPERLAALRKALFAPNHDASIWLNGWYPATLRMQHDAAKKSGLRDSWACGNVPLLQMIGEYDPFIPKPYWNEMREQFGVV